MGVTSDWQPLTRQTPIWSSSMQLSGQCDHPVASSWIRLRVVGQLQTGRVQSRLVVDGGSWFQLGQCDCTLDLMRPDCFHSANQTIATSHVGFWPVHCTRNEADSAGDSLCSVTGPQTAVRSLYWLTTNWSRSPSWIMLIWHGSCAFCLHNTWQLWEKHKITLSYNRIWFLDFLYSVDRVYWGVAVYLGVCWYFWASLIPTMVGAWSKY